MERRLEVLVRVVSTPIVLRGVRTDGREEELGEVSVRVRWARARMRMSVGGNSMFRMDDDGVGCGLRFG